MQKLLFPFSILYGFVTLVRNWAFDLGFLESYTPPVYSIGVGNLRVGGTGKTPMVEYLIRHFGAQNNIGVISRGYGRKTKGILTSRPDSKVTEIGDEPAQIVSKYPEVVFVVGGNRVAATKHLIDQNKSVEYLLFDDVYQHRYVKPHCLILLTAFDDLYVNDYMLPSGRLRELRSGAGRADIIVVTKCPEGLSDNDQHELKARLKPKTNQKVFFITVKKSVNQRVYGNASECSSNVVLVTGIDGSRRVSKSILKDHRIVKHFDFSDHYSYTPRDVSSILKECKSHVETDILTTEKDWQRLRPFVEDLNDRDVSIFIIPIEIVFLGNQSTQFNEALNDATRKN